MYEGDTPNAERRAAALALDRDLLRELLGQEELRELIDPEALEEVEAQLQHRTEAGAGRRPRRAPAGAARPRRPDRGRVRGAGRRGLLGGVDAGEARSPSAAPSRSGSPARSATSPPRTRGSTATRSGCLRPPACPTPSSSRVPIRWRRWCAATPAPTVPSRPRSSPRRYGIDPAPALRELERDGTLIRGELLPGGTEREWCDADVLRRVRRASLAHLRREVEPADRRELARFLPGWQNVDAYRAAGAGADRLREALIPLQGVVLTPRSGSATCCHAGSAPTARPGWTSSAPAARSSGSAPARWGEATDGSRCIPRGRAPGRPAAGEREARAPRGRGPRRDPRAAGRRAELLARPRGRHRGADRRSSTPRSGTSPGPAR